MRRHKSLIPLSQDHHNGLMLAQLIKKGAPEYKGLPTNIDGKVKFIKESWKNELKSHFSNEEKILFPKVSGKNAELDILINDLKEEHRDIEDIIVNLDSSHCLEDKINELGILLESHIRKEERVFFEKLQSLCKDELEELQGIILPANNNCKI